MKTRKAVKTAVSIPEPLFAEGEKFAKRLRLKRSQLYARALAELIRRYDSNEITRRLNEVYGPDGKGSELDPVLAAHVRRNLKKVEW